MEERVLRRFWLRSGRGGVQRIVREHYLRSDIAPFQAVQAAVGAAKERADGSTLEEAGEQRDGDHGAVWAVVGPDAAQWFLEVIEERAVQHVVVLQSILLFYQPRRGHGALFPSRYAERLARVGSDLKRLCCTFHNEHSAATFVRRCDEDIDTRNARAIAAAVGHLHQAAAALRAPLPRQVVLVSGDDAIVREMHRAGLGASVVSMEQYIEGMCGSSPRLKTLHSSLEAHRQRVLAEEKRKALQSDALGEKSVTGTGTPCGAIYREHLDPEEVKRRVRDGSLVVGTLHVSARKAEHALVRSEGGDIHIIGRDHRNRAVHGDRVAIERIRADVHGTLSISRDGRDSDEENEDEVTAALLPAVEDEDEEVVEQSPSCDAVIHGRVVGICKANRRPYVCTVQLSSTKYAAQEEELLAGTLDAAGGGGAQERVLVLPMDRRVPKIRIRTRQVRELAMARIVVQIDEWSADSVYPEGHYLYQIGEIGDIETETQCLLLENQLECGEFSELAMSVLPADASDWTVTPEEQSYRMDLRDLLVMSVDPEGCQDIDDALSFSILGNGKLQYGVHIADVSHFVPSGSVLDAEARHRGTSVYLADRRIDMLPSILSTQLCSLREKVDRFAMSVLWTVHPETLDVEAVTYGRSIIHSAHELSYERAQAILDGETEAMKGMQDHAQVRTALSHFIQMARKLRNGRKARGALKLESVEVKFDLSAEERLPVGVKTKRSMEVHSMVEEFMVWANETVAQKIHSAFPKSAVLRCHPKPREQDFSALISMADAMRINIDPSSNKTLSQSLDNAVDPTNPSVNFLLRSMATFAMSEAVYFSTGSREVDEFYHYGLAAPFYTHFTSPIRRYADLLVHRQLWEIVQGSQMTRALKRNPDLVLPAPTAELRSDSAMSEVCNHLNLKTRSAKYAQRDSSALFQTLYFAARGPEITETAVVYEVTERGFFVMLPKYGIRGHVYVLDREGEIEEHAREQLHIESFTPSKKAGPTFVKAVLRVGRRQVALKLFDHVQVNVAVEPQRARCGRLKLLLAELGGRTAAEHIQPMKMAQVVDACARKQKAPKRKVPKQPASVALNGKKGVYAMFERFRTKARLSTFALAASLAHQQS